MHQTGQEAPAGRWARHERLAAVGLGPARDLAEHLARLAELLCTQDYAEAQWLSMRKMQAEVAVGSASNGERKCLRLPSLARLPAQF